MHYGVRMSVYTSATTTAHPKQTSFASRNFPSFNSDQSNSILGNPFEDISGQWEMRIFSRDLCCDILDYFTSSTNLDHRKQCGVKRNQTGRKNATMYFFFPLWPIRTHDCQWSCLVTVLTFGSYLATAGSLKDSDWSVHILTAWKQMRWEVSKNGFVRFQKSFKLFSNVS